MKNTSFKKDSSPNSSFIFIASKKKEAGTMQFLWELSSVFWSVLAKNNSPYAFPFWTWSMGGGLAGADDYKIQGKVLVESVLEGI